MTFPLRAVESVEKCSWECSREGTKSRPLIVRLAGQCCPLANMAPLIVSWHPTIGLNEQRLSGTSLGGYFVLGGRLRALGDDRGSDGTQNEEDSQYLEWREGLTGDRRSKQYGHHRAE